MNKDMLNPRTVPEMGIRLATDAVPVIPMILPTPKI